MLSIFGKGVQFQPALPMRGVTSCRLELRSPMRFQPALPMRGVTGARISAPHTMRFQPALPMRGVTDLEAPMNGDI